MIKGQAIEDLKRDEGFVPHVYQDHLGYWTIGYGFLVDKRRGGGIPKHIAYDLLRWEVDQRWDQITKKLPWLNDQPDEVKRAIMNMTYQIGVAGTLGFKKMLEALRIGDREKAANELLDSKLAKQTPERTRRVEFLIRGHK